VEWLNAVDATYQVQLRELNELNFARFSAELKAGFAEMHAHLSARDALYERRFAELGTQISDTRIELRTELARVETRLAWQLTGTLATLVGVVMALGEQFLRR
jgi:hypothetical protein